MYLSYLVNPRQDLTSKRRSTREAYLSSSKRAGTLVVYLLHLFGDMRSLQKLWIGSSLWNTGISVFVSAYCLPLWLLSFEWANEHACSLNRNICTHHLPDSPNNSSFSRCSLSGYKLFMTLSLLCLRLSLNSLGSSSSPQEQSTA